MVNHRLYLALLLYLVTVVHVSLSDDGENGPKKVVVDAALVIGGKLHLIAGNEALVIGEDMKEDRVIPVSKLGIPEGFTITAAFKSTKSPNNAMLYGADNSLYVTFGDDLFTLLNKQTLEYGPGREFIANGGPDATAKGRDTRVFFFKECDMAVGKGWTIWKLPEHNWSRGLPCHVDAAWSHPGSDGEIIVLKGDQLWRWTQGKASGPQNFHQVYSVQSWTLAFDLEDE